MQDQEILTGYLMDVACARKQALPELYDSAPDHTKACALMGHCMESGYAIIDVDGRQLALLDSAATPQVLALLHQDSREKGNAVRVTRRRDGQEMRTVKVEPH